MLARLPYVEISARARGADAVTLGLEGVVASDLITRVAGKRLATTIGRRIPLVGGVVGMGADGYATWKVGRYADRELLPRAKR